MNIIFSLSQTVVASAVKLAVGAVKTTGVYIPTPKPENPDNEAVKVTLPLKAPTVADEFAIVKEPTVAGVTSLILLAPATFTISALFLLLPVAVSQAKTSASS